jgi:hypothetical protein
MLIYEYPCKVCGAVSEFLPAVDQNQTIPSPKYGSLVMEKDLLTPFGF